MRPVTQRGLVLFALMSVIWGIPYLFIRIAVEEIIPAILVFARTALAAAILLPIVFGRVDLRADPRPLAVAGGLRRRSRSRCRGSLLGLRRAAPLELAGRAPDRRLAAGGHGVRAATGGADRFGRTGWWGC